MGYPLALRGVARLPAVGILEDAGAEAAQMEGLADGFFRDRGGVVAEPDAFSHDPRGVDAGHAFQQFFYGTFGDFTVHVVDNQVEFIKVTRRFHRAGGNVRAHKEQIAVGTILAFSRTVWQFFLGANPTA